MERHEKLNFEIEMSRKIQLNETLNLLVEHTKKKLKSKLGKLCLSVCPMVLGKYLPTFML